VELLTGGVILCVITGGVLTGGVRPGGVRPGGVRPGAGAYLSQHSEAAGVQLWGLQLDHAHPAILVQIFLVIVVTESQRVHLEGPQQERPIYHIYIYIYII